MKAAAAAVGLRDGRGAGPIGVFVQSKTAFRAAERTRLMNGYAAPGSFRDMLASQSFLSHAPGGALARALWTDRHLYLANDLTYKMDIALGAWGMEGRAPFLDHRILEWSQSLPPGELVRGNQKKILLHAAYTRDLPAKVLDRSKHGFGAPVSAWLNGPLREMAAEAVPSPLLNRKGQRYLAGQQLWTLVAFSSWARQWRATW
jgi:asparagine synthetase B (glutamine-hydrolysing)